MLEIPCDVDDAIWRSSDSALFTRCLADLDDLGFPHLQSRIRDSFSSFVREGYPVYHLGYQDDRRQVLRHVSQVPGVVSCGRQGGFRYIFMDTAMEMGVEAAQAILSGRSGASISEIAAEPEYREAKALTA
jgi:protoporphyrinogen oxidase